MSDAGGYFGEEMGLMLRINEPPNIKLLSLKLYIVGFFASFFL